METKAKSFSLATSHHTPLAAICFCLLAIMFTSCGGSNSPPPPPVADFTVSLSPSTIIQQAGGASTPFTVTIGSRNGFSGSVTVALSGLPTGTTTSPASPFVVAAGSSQVVTLQIPRTVVAGNFQVALNGTSGTLAHSAALALSVTPAEDFGLSISPAQLAATVGTVSAPFSVSIAGQNGFTDTVTVVLSGLPAGASSQPASPFTVAAGQSQAVTISVPASAGLGSFTVQVAATGGSLSHTAQLGLTLMLIETFDNGAGLLYLETDTSTEITRVGLQKSWGGSIIEVSLNGTDYVNNDDPGRQIQTSLWDANANYSTSWGYSPTEAGDHFFDGSPLLTYTLQPDSVYTKTQPIQWAPENFGGGPGNPVLGDAYIEKWISVVPGYNRVFKVHYKITHFGTDTHAEALQELPVMYVNPNVSLFFYYGGSAPWTNDALSQHTMPSACCDILPTPEQWGAYVDSTNTGITLYTPGQYPDSKGFNAGSTLQFTPMSPYSWDPGAVLEFDTFILAGSVQESRAAIYALHSQQSQSTLPAMGSLDVPASGDVLTGNSLVEGWAWALSGMASVDVFADGNRVASASYGLNRPEIPNAFPGAPSNVGYQYSLDTTAFSNGSHTVIVKATDKAGHVSTFQTRQVTFSN